MTTLPDYQTDQTEPTPRLSTLELLALEVGTSMPRTTYPFWFEGWPGDIEAALIDAVFSGRAAYGTSTTGVRKVVSTWRSFRGDVVDDLDAFLQVSEDDIADRLGNRQRVPGNALSKAEAMQHAARALHTVGVRQSRDVTGSDRQRAAFVSVPGVGAATWLTFLIALGIDTPETVALDGRFVSRTVGWVDVDVDHEIEWLARFIGCTPAAAHHAIRRFERRQG